MTQSTLGKRMGEARAMAGMTQLEWLRALGSDSDRSGTVSEWEHNKSIPDVTTIQRMLDLSGMDGHYLMTGEGPAVRTAEDRDTHTRASAYDRIEAVVLQVRGELEAGRLRIADPVPVSSQDAQGGSSSSSKRSTSRRTSRGDSKG